MKFEVNGITGDDTLASTILVEVKGFYVNLKQEELRIDLSVYKRRAAYDEGKSKVRKPPFDKSIVVSGNMYKNNVPQLLTGVLSAMNTFVKNRIANQLEIDVTEVVEVVEE